MTQDEIIEMAVQSEVWIEKGFLFEDVLNARTLAFAKLVAAKERESCAKVCEDNATDLSEGDWDSACINCADHIRERGKT